MNDVTEQNTLPARIAIVTSAGGSEHEVSLRSAGNVCSALQQSFPNIQIFPFDADLENALLAWQPDVVFPVAHGAGGESGDLQALLDTLAVVYVGSDAASSAICWDKAVANKSLAEWLVSTPTLPKDFSRCSVPPFITIQRSDDIATAVLDFCTQLPSEAGLVVIKPAREGSSCGISFCTTPHYAFASKSEVISGINGPIWKARLDHIVECVEQTFALDSSVIVQEAIQGTEITVAVLEDPDARALPVVEIVTPRGEWYDYEHKYSVGGSKHIIPARLPDWVSKLAQQVAVSMHRQLGCRDLSRVDFIVGHPQNLLEKHRLWFLEINTLPGFTATSLYPDAAKSASLSMSELVRRLTLLAWARARMGSVDTRTATLFTPVTHNQFDKKSTAWSALFSEPMSELVKRYTASVFFDKRLWQADIAGSLAHAEMLAAQGIIAGADYEAIQRGMSSISAEIEAGQFEWRLDLEDVHLNIEARLTQLVGDAGKRLHTGRSRNDQVATDVRLWLRDEIDLIVGLLIELQKALLEVAEKNVEVILPGFTHLQVAQPVSFGHHLLAYVEMFSRDAQRMGEVRSRTNRLPLGAAALAGTSYPLDRERVAKTLGMVDAQGQPEVCQNSLDAVSDRDFAIEFAAAASLCMVHISRFSEELVLWMSQNFGFIRIADRFTTGSSIMPQKKNPDVPELARGKTGRVVGHLMGLLTLMKGQPLAYNKDNQEDKEPLFDTVDTLKDTLRIFAEMVGGQINSETGMKEGGISVNAERMESAADNGYATATDLADYLVKKGMAFRDAHEVVAHAVKAATSHQIDLSELPLAVLKQFNPAIEKDVYECLSLRGSLNARNTLGGTAPQQVRSQIERHRARLMA